MLGFTTRQIGDQAFMEFADAVINAADVQSVYPDDENPGVAMVFLRGRDRHDEMPEHRFRLMTVDAGATILLDETDGCP